MPDIHWVVMFLLYFCLGLGQGTLTVVPLLYVQKNPSITTATQATLSLPVFLFSFKFLWGDIVDSVYIRGWYTGRGWKILHRRVQWVFLLQVLNVVCFTSFAVSSASQLTLSVNKNTFNILLLFLIGVGSLCSMLDVVVDKWTVEGLPVTKQSSSGRIQLTGAVSGISFCGIFVQLIQHFPSQFTLKLLFFSCAASSLLSTVLALLLAIVRKNIPRFGDNEDAATFLPNMGKVLFSNGVRDAIRVHLSRGWAQAIPTLVQSFCLHQKFLTVSTLQFFRSCGSILEVMLVGTVAPKIVKKYHAITVIRVETTASLVTNCCLLFCFVFISGYPLVLVYGVLFPVSLMNASLSALLSVSNMTLSGELALNYPVYLGAVMSLLNAFANVGNTLPSVSIMYLSDVVGRFSGTGGLPHTPVLSKFSVVVSGLIFTLLGCLLRYKWLIPSVNRLLFNEDIISKI